MVKTLPILTRATPNNLSIINNLPFDFYYPNLGYYSKNVMNSLFLANQNWPFHAQTLRKMAPLNKKFFDLDIFNFDPSLFNLNIKTARNITHLLEINFLSFFRDLVNDGIKVSLYNKTKIIDYSPQKQPDILLDFTSSKYQSQRNIDFQHMIISMDQKTAKNYLPSANKILSIKPHIYENALIMFEKQLAPYNYSVEELSKIKNMLKGLQNNCTNTQEHINFWYNNLQLFHYKSPLPPLRVNEMANTSAFTNDAFLNYSDSPAVFSEAIDLYAKL